MSEIDNLMQSSKNQKFLVIIHLINLIVSHLIIPNRQLSMQSSPI